MIFFVVHHVIHNMPGIKDWKESKKNITTFLVGGLLYVFLMSFLYSPRYAALMDSWFILFTLKNWFMWILGIDVTAMAVIYKKYWGRSILEELPEAWEPRRKKKLSTKPEPPQEEKAPVTSEQSLATEEIPEVEPLKTTEDVLFLHNEDDGRDSYQPEGESDKPLGDAYQTTIDKPKSE